LDTCGGTDHNSVIIVSKLIGNGCWFWSN